MGLMRDYISLVCATDNSQLGEVLFVYKLTGVYAEIVKGEIIDTDGENNSNNTLCIVPYNKKGADGEIYLKPKAWEALNLSSKQSKYTFREGDLVLINQTPTDCKSIEEIKQKYDDCFTIQMIRDYNKVYPHFELVCR